MLFGIGYGGRYFILEVLEGFMIGIRFIDFFKGFFIRMNVNEDRVEGSLYNGLFLSLFCLIGKSCLLYIRNCCIFIIY